MNYYSMLKPYHYWKYAEQAVGAGIQGFEITYYESYLSKKEYADYLELIHRVKEELDVGFAVHAPIKDVNLGSLNHKLREAAKNELRSSLDLAKDIHAEVVIIHGSPMIISMPGGERLEQPHEFSPQQRREIAEQEHYLVKNLQELADYDPEIYLGLENLVFPHELYRSPQELQELIEKVDRSNVGLTFDAGHALINGYSASDFINILAERLVHVHLHDNHGRLDEHLPLGEGVLDYVAIIQILRDLGYQGAVTLEFILHDPRQFKEYLA